MSSTKQHREISGIPRAGKLSTVSAMAAPDLERLRQYWDKQARNYDSGMAFFDRRLFGDTREWVCGQAEGATLEVAIGTGLNLPFYPDEVTLTGVELSPVMLDQAKTRATELGRTLDARVGDAQRLEFPDESFDTVVATFSLCAITDHEASLAEMFRVLRPGGLLLLADHVVSTWFPVVALQWLVERVSIPFGGENFRRRPYVQVVDQGYAIERHDRFKAGIVERLTARKPG